MFRCLLWNAYVLHCVNILYCGDVKFYFTVENKIKLILKMWHFHVDKQYFINSTLFWSYLMISGDVDPICLRQRSIYDTIYDLPADVKAFLHGWFNNYN